MLDLSWRRCASLLAVVSLLTIAVKQGPHNAPAGKAANPPATPSQGSPEPDDSNESKAPTLAGEYEYLRPLWELLNSSQPEEESEFGIESLAAMLQKLRAKNIRSNKSGFTAEFIIATLPDPRRAGSDFLTDALLETIKRAVEAPGRITASRQDEVDATWARASILDRYWLPWKPDNRPSEETDYARFGEGKPGVMVFRKLSTPGVVVVLIVGEHPSIGVDRVALRRALHAVDRLHVRPSDPAGRFLVLGPTFTGSQDSLAEGLGEYGNRNVLWVNGSATALRIKRIRELARRRPGTKFDYKATIIPDQILQRCLLHYLAREPQDAALDSLDRLALLVESDTGYGQTNATLLSGPDGLGLPEGVDAQVIPFPMNVSRALAAYQALRQQSLQRLPQLQGMDVRMKLPLETYDMRYRSLRPFEPELTAVRVDLLLRDIVRTLQQRRTRYIGIVATSSLDKLFLATMVRQACPDARVFTTTGDLLLTHPEVSADLRGVLIASTYPLFGANQYWTGPNDANLQAAFAHQSELGIYNAVQLLLDRPGSMMEYRTPFTARQGTDRPPVWISVVGRDGIYPVSYYNLSQLKRILDPDCAKQKHWRGIEAKIADLAEVELIPVTEDKGVKRAVRDGSSQADEGEPAAASGGSSAAEEAGKNPGAGLWWLISCTLATMAFLYIGYEVIDALRGARRENLRLAAIASAALATGWGCAAWYLRGVGWRWHFGAVTKLESWITFGWLTFVTLTTLLRTFRPLPRTPLGALAYQSSRSQLTLGFGSKVFLVTAVPAAALTVLALYVIESRGAGDTVRLEYLDSVRTVNLQAGISPLAPLFFFGLSFVLLGYSQWTRDKEFSSANREIGAAPRPNHSAFERFNRCVQELENAAVPTLHALAYKTTANHLATFAVLALLVAPAATKLASGSSIDGWLHDWLCAAAFVSAFVIIGGHLLWLTALWARLRDVLREMAAMPLSGGFDRLPGLFATAASGELLLWIRRNHGKMISLLEQQLRMLSSAATGQQSPGARGWSGLSSAVADRMASYAEFYWPAKTLQEGYPKATKRPDFIERTAPHVNPQGAIANDPGPASPWTRQQTEILIAGVLFTSLMPFLVMLRRLAWGVLLASCALLLGVWSYPFAPSALMQVSGWAMIALAAHRFWRIASQLNQDEVISRVAGTVPNKTTWSSDFITTNATYLSPIVLLLLYSYFGLPHYLIEQLSRLGGR